MSADPLRRIGWRSSIWGQIDPKRGLTLSGEAKNSMKSARLYRSDPISGRRLRETNK